MLERIRARPRDEKKDRTYTQGEGKKEGSGCERAGCWLLAETLYLAHGCVFTT